MSSAKPPKDERNIYVDEAWYTARYPDVKPWLAAREGASATDHFQAVGNEEGRQPFLFDPEWYVKAHPDVAAGIERGRISDPMTHYVRFGRFENRRPAPPEFEPQPNQVFAFGAYGTNNVGDEAIYHGIRSLHPNAVQIFHYKTTEPNSLLFSDCRAFPDRVFRSDSHLIIGGGGLLYSKPALGDMLFLGKLAKKAGAHVEVLGIGAESAKEDYFDEIRELVSLADRVSVRSSISREIIETICQRSVEQQRDFAFRLAPQVPPRNSLTGARVPVIGVVTGGDIRVNYSHLVEAIASTFRKFSGNSVRFVHIPHSQAYMTRHNNDVVVGNAIWSDLKLHRTKDVSAFTLRPFTSDPFDLLRFYSGLDGIISSRFHGMIFAKLAGLPTLAMGAHTIKNQSFVQDNPSPDLFVAENPDTFPQKFSALVERVLQSP